MNSLFLIDTSVWILALRKKYTPEIKSYVEKLIEERESLNEERLSRLGSSESNYDNFVNRKVFVLII